MWYLSIKLFNIIFLPFHTGRTEQLGVTSFVPAVLCRTCRVCSLFTLFAVYATIKTLLAVLIGCVLKYGPSIPHMSWTL
jgi:hypothetical protein